MTAGRTNRRGAKARSSLFLALLPLACGPSSGQRWVGELPEQHRGGGEGVWEGVEPSGGATADAGAPRTAPDELYRNTYYDFPSDPGGDRSATLFDAACAPIAKVSRRFHDLVCVQGSGRLTTGVTVSFAKRGCACAAVCPRTGQQICFDRLDPAGFPFGRGASGRPITPLRSVAVDSAVIPLGSVVYIPAYAGVPRPDGTPHDGCFVAEDRGLKVVGLHVDIFTGDPAVTAAWNKIVPSNRGVHVHVDEPRCR